MLDSDATRVVHSLVSSAHRGLDAGGKKVSFPHNHWLISSSDIEEKFAKAVSVVRKIDHHTMSVPFQLAELQFAEFQFAEP